MAMLSPFPLAPSVQSHHTMPSRRSSHRTHPTDTSELPSPDRQTQDRVAKHSSSSSLRKRLSSKLKRRHSDPDSHPSQTHVDTAQPSTQSTRTAQTSPSRKDGRGRERRKSSVSDRVKNAWAALLGRDLPAPQSGSCDTGTERDTRQLKYQISNPIVKEPWPLMSSYRPAQVPLDMIAPRAEWVHDRTTLGSSMPTSVSKSATETDVLRLLHQILPPGTSNLQEGWEPNQSGDRPHVIQVNVFPSSPSSTNFDPSPQLTSASFPPAWDRHVASQLRATEEPLPPGYTPRSSSFTDHSAWNPQQDRFGLENAYPLSPTTTYNPSSHSSVPLPLSHPLPPPPCISQISTLGDDNSRASSWAATSPSLSPSPADHSIQQSGMTPARPWTTSLPGGGSLETTSPSLAGMPIREVGNWTQFPLGQRFLKDSHSPEQEHDTHQLQAPPSPQDSGYSSMPQSPMMPDHTTDDPNLMPLRGDPPYTLNSVTSNPPTIQARPLPRLPSSTTTAEVNSSPSKHEMLTDPAFLAFIQRQQALHDSGKAAASSFI